MSCAQPETRVAFLSERSDLFGGGQLSLCELVGALRGTHVRSLVITPGPGALTDDLDRLGVEWITLPLPRWLAAAGMKALWATARLIRLVRARRIDLLHSDTPRTALYGGLAARLTGRRHVLHLRASRASGILDRLLVALSDRLIAVSRAAASRSSAVAGSPRTRVIATGLAPIPFLPRDEARSRLGLPREAFVLGAVGRIEDDKGRDDALLAMASVRREVPGALLAFLGPLDPDDPWTRTCALRAAALGASGSLRLLGAHPAAARLFKAFDVLLHPSRHEALPRVVIEALFAEVPVVASSVGGIPEIVESGHNGLLVPPGDPEGLARAVLSLARDPKEAARLARAGSEKARSRYRLDRMSEAILAVYDELRPPRPNGAVGRSRAAASPARGATP